MCADPPGGGRALEDAIAILRRRGYLGRHGHGVPRRAVGRAFGMTAAGLLLVLAGLAVAAVYPPGPRTVLVTTALLAPLLFAGMVLAWLAVAAAVFLHRRGIPAGLAAAGAGVAGATASLALVVGAGHPWTPPWGAAVGLGFLLAILGAGLVLRGLTRAVVLRILRRIPTGDLEPPRLWRLTLGTLTAVVLVLGLELLLAAPRGSDSGKAEILHVRPTRARLAIVAVDGASRKEVTLLARRDPGLRQMGAWRWAALDEPEPGASLPVRWITVATGVAPGRRGVATFRQVAVGAHGPVLLLPPVLRRIVTGLWSAAGIVEEQTVPAAHRKAPTIWEMASRAGLTVRVLGWWGSFPPRRVRGVVASERWLLTGTASRETVFPVGPAADLGDVGGTKPLDMDRRALAALSGPVLRDPSLVMVYLPGWWLESRHMADRGATLVAAQLLEPHLEILGTVIRRLLGRGFTVCVVGMEPGCSWVLWSVGGGAVRAVRPAGLVDTWLDALGLPPAAGLGGGVRRDLSGITGKRPAPPAVYGSPPPLAAAAPAAEGAAQLELLKSLGYLN